MNRIIVILLFLAFQSSLYSDEAIIKYDKSITVSPFHFLCPELHLTSEFKLFEKISFALITGGGQITDEGKTSYIWEAGIQFRYYIIGSFIHGLMIGADAGYIDINKQIENPVAYLIGIHAGGFLGYKYTWDLGPVFEIQIGPIYLWGKTQETSEIQTLLNFKTGWLF